MKTQRLLAMSATAIALFCTAAFGGADHPTQADGTAAATMAAASGDYVLTFDLPTTPTTAGAYAGIDPSKANVVFWHQQTKTREQAIKDAVAKFNQSNPWHITVTPIYKGAYADIFQAMLAAIQTKDLPQLTVAYQNEAAEYQNAKALVDYNDFVNDPVYGLGKSLTNDFYSGFLSADVNPQFNNQRLGYAIHRSMESLFYNVDALKALGYDAPPTSWDQFKEMACKYVKAGSGNIGYEVRTDASAVAAAAFAQNGNVYDYAQNKFILDSPEVQVFPQTMKDMLSQGCAILPKAVSADEADFAAGKSLFYSASSSDIITIQADQKKDKTTFNFDIAPVPYKDHPVQNVYGASISMPKTTKQQELAAWLFLRWFTEPEQQATWVKVTYYFPVRQSTKADLADFFAANPIYQHAFDLLGSTQGEPALAAWNPVRGLITKSFQNVLGTNGTDGKPVQDEFTALNGVANNVLAANPAGAILPTPLPTKTPAPATLPATALATSAPTASQ